jgi:cytochrome c biogenesis protein CcmG/thiol:disulfide interchange protein DsbE
MNKIPFILFAVLVVFLAVLLLKGKDPTVLDSVMIGKPVPHFNLSAALKGDKGFSSKDLTATPAIVNVFASWCMECRLEQDTLTEIGRAEKIPVYGIDYKDTPEKLTGWLKKYGNPYAAIGADPHGLTAIDWGVYGVPETFIVDARGIIRYKHIGAVTDKTYRAIFKPLLAELKR